MTDSEYLEIMIALTQELQEKACIRPYDPEAYNKVIERIQSVQPPWELRRRRRPWLALACCIILMIVLLYIVYSILCFLWIINSQ